MQINSNKYQQYNNTTGTNTNNNFRNIGYTSSGSSGNTGSPGKWFSGGDSGHLIQVVENRKWFLEIVEVVLILVEVVLILSGDSGSSGLIVVEIRHGGIWWR